MCIQCEKKPVYKFTNKRTICGSCFINYFQRKVFYVNRKFKLITPGDVVGFTKKKDLRGVVLEEVLKLFAERGQIELIKLPSKKRITKEAISSTIDIESNEVINKLIKGSVSELEKIFPTHKKIIRPLYLFLDEEVLIYAKLRNLKFKPIKAKKDKINNFVDTLEKKHPEVKRSVLNSWLELR